MDLIENPPNWQYQKDRHIRTQQEIEWYGGQFVYLDTWMSKQRIP